MVKIKQVSTQAKATQVSALAKLLRTLGPGLITGASDDDPSGIGTFSQTGARFGYAQLWTALFTFPLMLTIQEICARIALETGSGLADTLRKFYPRSLLYLCVGLLLMANTINIGADLGAMAAAGQMLVGIPFLLWLVLISLVSVALQVFVNYKRYAQILRVLTLSLLAYVLVPFVARMDWKTALTSTVIPTLQFNTDYAMNLVAILGTTISPYLFFWQASQEVEEKIEQGKTTPRQRQGVSKSELKWMRADVASGMGFSQIVQWFIIATTAATLSVNGIHTIESATQAAEALRPIAGDLAYLLFAVGIIGTGLLAVPILAGSAAYAVAETFKMREGLYQRLREAPGFYSVIVVAVLVGVGINLIGLDPIKGLYYAAILNGIIAPPLLFVIMLIANNRTIMKKRVNGRWSNLIGWITTGAMSLAAAALLISLVAQ
ncbi:MAG: Nramp family divalent metal transporter [Chloroflexi bacterium]|nr:Nramp family divalent metal transporter [Chloroflexota bacterium]